MVKPKAFRSSRSQMFYKLGVLENFKIHRKTPQLESLFNKVARPTETLSKVFSYDFCKIFKSTL